MINTAGIANPRLFDVAFPHATGIRPYSYGLQACELTARMLVTGWKHTLRDAAAECEALA